jgi:hypothetical protein
MRLFVANHNIFTLDHYKEIFDTEYVLKLIRSGFCLALRRRKFAADVENVKKQKFDVDSVGNYEISVLLSPPIAPEESHLRQPLPTITPVGNL